MKYVRVLKLTLFVSILMIFSGIDLDVKIGAEALAAETPGTECMEILIDSQVITGANLKQLADSLASYLSQKTADELSASNSNYANSLAFDMRKIFFDHREVLYDADGNPQPITGGAGFGTLDASGEPENLFGIYQANTASAVCGMPYAPKCQEPINTDDASSPTVKNTASPAMQFCCWLLPRCKNMRDSLFLNLSNKRLAGDKLKRMYNNANYFDTMVYKTFQEWAPGGDARGSWPQLGYQAYEAGNMDGGYVVFQQENLSENLLLYYRPFNDVDGNFAGTAYAFTNLYEESLKNNCFKNAISTGVCPEQSTKCLIKQ